MLWLPPVAFLLDLFLADPRSLPHPVQGIALLADKLEQPARAMRNQSLAGALVLVVLLLISGSIAAVLVRLPSFAGTVAALYLAWSGLALGSLLREGGTALALVARAGASRTRGEEDPGYAQALAQAREAVGMLVSRDTGDMDPDGLCRSLAESVSENFNDAFAAPFFWLCLTGPVGLWLYKTASTMDSLWGYKNERWLRLGKASARLDDVLAYIPARISVLLMFVTARLAGRTKEGWRDFFGKVRQQARLCDSPNAGWPMAAAAWLFNGGSGGPTPYDGRMVDKPRLGPEQGRWTPANTAALLSHVRRAGILGGALGTGLVLFFSGMRL